jgi:hypothetical protein
MSTEQHGSIEVCKSADRTRFACAWPWVSGFFAAPAFVHLVRVLAGWHVIIGENEIPMMLSWICVFVCGLLSIVCAMLGCRNGAKGR